MINQYTAFTGKSGMKVLAFKKINYDTMQCSIRVTGITKDGFKIPGKNIKLTTLFKEAKCLDFLIDAVDGLELSEVNGLRTVLIEKLNEWEVMEEGTPAKVNDYYPLITGYIRDHAGKEDGICIEEDYGFIPSKDMEDVIHSLDGCENCSKEDFIEVLAMQKVLKTNDNRNTVVKAVGKKRIRYYSIKMPGKVSEAA